MNKVDLIIIAIIGLFMLIGYWRGIVGTVFSLIQYVVIIYLSVVLSPHLSAFLVSVLKADAVILEWIYNHPDMINGALTSMSDELLQNIVGRLISAMSLIVLFILLKLVCTLIFMILNRIAKLPILNEINKLGGMITGALVGVAIVYVLMILINWLPVSAVDGIKEQLPNSVIASKIDSYVPSVTEEIISLIKV